jgi:ribonuclease P protein component
VPAAPKAVIVSPSDDAPAEVASDGPGIGQDRAGERDGSFVLREPAEFERCLARPALVRGGPFALHLSWRPEPATAAGGWRLGLVIPKRHEASAVARNTIKRRWRASFRRGRAAWASEFGSADVVVRMQAPLVPKSAGAVSEPARVRARDRFDPGTLFDALAARLRGRHGKSRVAAADDRSTASVARTIDSACPSA